MKSLVWVVLSVIAGWLVAYPVIEYTSAFFTRSGVPKWIMIILGLYLTMAVSKHDLLWGIRRFI